MDSVLRTLMGPWTTYILWILRSAGPQRFGELKRKVEGVSAKVLTERLRGLEGAGLITRHYAPTIPPQVTYALAARGGELASILDAINAVALKWAAEDGTHATPEPRQIDAGEARAARASQ
jgi:DNA-binding HxlR family transcriptional regulator